MNRFYEINELVEELNEDLTKFYEKGNKAAGTRARKTLQKVKLKAQQARNEIIQIRDTDSFSGSDTQDYLNTDYPEESGGSDDW